MKINRALSSAISKSEVLNLVFIKQYLNFNGSGIRQSFDYLKRYYLKLY